MKATVRETSYSLMDLIEPYPLLCKIAENRMHVSRNVLLDSRIALRGGIHYPVHH